jgi:hypothetical protein
VKKAILVSDPQARAKLCAGAGDFISRPLDHPGDRETFYATRSNVSGYSVSLMGSDFSKVKLN